MLIITNHLEPRRGDASQPAIQKVIQMILAGYTDAAINQCCAECRLALKNIKQEIENTKRKGRRSRTFERPN